MRMSLFSGSEKKTRKLIGANVGKSSFSERVYKPLQRWEVGLGREPGLDLCQTPWCAQYMWSADAYFPCCPKELRADSLGDYFQNLKAGAVLAYSDDDIFPKFTVVESKILKKNTSILVMSERADGKWSIVGIERDEKSSHFVHFFLGSYSNKDEADKAFFAKNELTSLWSEAYSNAYDFT